MSLSVPRNLPPGYRFRPTDEELMNHFLRLKMIRGCSDVDDDIAEVDDVCMWDPWELRLKSKIESDDQISWFFSRRDPKNKRTKRKTKTGFWKITGKEQEIKGRDGRVIGKKKIVVFLTGPTPGRGTDWVIHEYHPLPENVLPNQSYYVICRLENKAVEKAGPPGCDDSEPSCDITSDVENSVASAAISEVHGQAEGNAELLPQHFQYHDIASDVENSVASVAISEVHGQAEGNAESLPQQVLSSDDCFLTDEEINFLNACLDNDHTQLMPEHHPETENSLLHQRPDITHCLESKTDENAGTLGCNIGKPSSDIRAETENSVAHHFLVLYYSISSLRRFICWFKENPNLMRQSKYLVKLCELIPLTPYRPQFLPLAIGSRKGCFLCQLNSKCGGNWKHLVGTTTCSLFSLGNCSLSCGAWC